jgi:membrane-associated protease RseP (regulator of RpoE activity)
MSALFAKLRIADVAVSAILILAGFCSPALTEFVDKANERLPVLQMVALSKEVGMARTDSPNGQGFCGWLGVRVSQMTRPFAESLGMTTPYGAIFGRPQPGSPAAEAKIEAGDVITAVNGSSLRSWREFSSMISSFAPGTTVYFTTYRDGQLIDRAVTLRYGKCPHRAPKSSDPSGFGDAGTRLFFSRGGHAGRLESEGLWRVQ